jgi:hypothetical protein
MAAVAVATTEELVRETAQGIRIAAAIALATEKRIECHGL